MALGMITPTVSGTLMEHAPASCTALYTDFMKSRSERVASSQENCTFRPCSRAYSTDSTALALTSSGVIFSLYFMCRSEVAMKVWM